LGVSPGKYLRGRKQRRTVTDGKKLASSVREGGWASENKRENKTVRVVELAETGKKVPMVKKSR